MPRHAAFTPRGLALALAFTAAAIGLRWLLDPWLGAHTPYITLFAAVALAIRYAGPAPALVAALCGLPAAELLFVQPRGGIEPQHALIAALLFLGACGVMIRIGAIAENNRRHAEQAVLDLADSKAQLQQVLDALPLLISYVDSEYRYRFNNQAYQSWFGLDPEQLKGRRVADVIGPAAFATALPGMERALAGEALQFEREADYGPGGRRWVEYRFIPHCIGSRVEGFFAVLEDVTERKAAEHARARLAAIVESTDDAIMSKTLDGMVTSWNGGAERLFGWRPDEMIGQPVTRIIPPELLHQERDILGRIGRNEPVPPFDTQRLRSDGRRVAVSLTVSPLRDPRGAVIGASKIARDITERKRIEAELRNSEQRFRLLADNAPMLVWRSDRQHAGAWFNRVWLEFTGRTLEQELGDGWAASIHPDDRDKVLGICMPAFERREPFEMEFRLRRHDGEYRWLLDRGVPMYDGQDGGFSGFIGSCLDITEHRRLEQRLRDSIEQLAESDRRKDEFLATLAHELRNPLAPILGAAQSMQLLAARDERLAGAWALIERQARHMRRLVDDLLDLSRITRGRIVLQPAPTQLDVALRLAVEACQPQIDEAGHRLELSLPPGPLTIFGDPTRLTQVFGNLLGNAAKYTPPGGSIVLSLEQDGADAVVRIRDSGVGIAPEMLDRVFEMFAQDQRSQAQRQGGLGIGLTLARQLVGMHGGSIQARSEGIGRGSEFIVRLPLSGVAQPALPQPAPLSAPVAAAGALRILVADDNADAAEAMLLMLQLLGHEVQVVHDGAEAVVLATRWQPDVALLDIGMPKLDGYAAARRIADVSPRTRLFALTGWGQEEDRRRALDAGFAVHLTKPVDVELLTRLLAGTDAGSALDPA